MDSRYNFASDKTGSYHSLVKGVGVTGKDNVAASGAGGFNFVSATDLHLQPSSVALDAVLDLGRQDGGWESSALTGRFLLDVDYQARPPGANGACFGSATACWDVGGDEYGAPTAVKLMSFSASPGTPP